MRELARCLAWTLGIGTVALLVAAFASRGLAQADGMVAWAVFLAYSPFYLLGHAFHPDAAQGIGESHFDATVFAAQFAYFFVVVVVVRHFYRMRRRRRA